jgi:hypothetical protein
LTCLEKSLALAGIGVVDILLPLEEDGLLDNVRLVERHEPAQQHPLRELLLETEHLEQNKTRSIFFRYSVIGLKSVSLLVYY